MPPPRRPLHVDPPRHPMAPLFCPREIVHDASPDTVYNANRPPFMFHLELDFDQPSHRPVYYPELVRLKNVEVFREGTRRALKFGLSSNVDTINKFFLKKIKEAIEDLEGFPEQDTYYIDEEKRRVETYPEPEDSARRPCAGACCNGGPEPELDRVMYRFMGEVRANLWLLEALHFEIFLPDRMDLRYLQVAKRVVDRWKLKEGMLVWLSSSALDSVPHRSRYRYRTLSDNIPYYMCWKVNNIIDVVCEDVESWKIATVYCASDLTGPTYEKAGEKQPREVVSHKQSHYYGGVSARFPEPIYGRAAVLDSVLNPQTDVKSMTVTKREACWLYPIEPLRNHTVYRRVVDFVEASNVQSGYRIDDFSTEVLEDSICAEEHARWFHNQQLTPELFVRKIERSLAFGIAQARVDQRDPNVLCIKEFGGYLHCREDEPRIVIYPSLDKPPMSLRYAQLMFNSAVTKEYYMMSIDNWNFDPTVRNDYKILTGRKSFALAELCMNPAFEEYHNLPCVVRFTHTPADALDKLLRKDLDNPESVFVPSVFAELYDVVLDADPGTSEIPKRSSRVHSCHPSAAIYAEEHWIRYSCAHPTTSFTLIGKAESGKTICAALMALASPERYNKLILTTNRQNGETLWFHFLMLYYTPTEFPEVLTPNDPDSEWEKANIPRRKRPERTRYEDSNKENAAREMMEFLTWPTPDIAIATMDSALQILYHHQDDVKDPFPSYLKDIHTVIIDSAEGVSEAYFYLIVKLIRPKRVILVGDHDKARELIAEQFFFKQGARSILGGIVNYHRPHTMPILQIKRFISTIGNCAFYMRASLADSQYCGLYSYVHGRETGALAEALAFLRQCRVQMKNVVILTMEKRHQEAVQCALSEYEHPLPDIEEFNEFMGQVRPVVIILGGWYARRYWYERYFKDLFTTMFLDMLIFISFNNHFKMTNFSESGARRCLVEKKLCEFPKKKK